MVGRLQRYRKYYEVIVLVNLVDQLYLICTILAISSMLNADVFRGILLLTKRYFLLLEIDFVVNFVD